MGLGSDAPLTEQGYQSVAALKSNEETEVFVRRTAEEMGLRLDSNADSAALFSGFLPWFSGTTAVQTIRKLRAELLAVPWASVTVMTGDNVPLTEEGYQQLAGLKNTPEMVKLIKRILEQTDSSCGDDGRLLGLAVHYSGEAAVQSLARLQEELSKVDWVERTTATWWKADARWDGRTAEERAKYLMDSQGLQEEAARWKVRSEFPMRFGGGVAGGSAKFGERFARVPIPDFTKGLLRIEVRPVDPTGISLVAVHYSVDGSDELNFDICKPDLEIGAWVHTIPSFWPPGDGYPDVTPSSTIRYWLYMIRNGVGEQEPADATSAASRLEVKL